MGCEVVATDGPDPVSLASHDAAFPPQPKHAVSVPMKFPIRTVQLLLGCLAAIVAATTFAADQQKHPAEEQGVKSIHADVETRIRFVNKSGRTIKVFWIDYEGTRKPYATLQNGEVYEQEKAYVTHPWLVSDENDNAWYIYYPDAQPRTVEVFGPPGESARQAPAKATIDFEITIDDPMKVLDGQEADVKSNVLTAAHLWAENFAGEATVQILLRIDAEANLGRGSGRSLAASRVKSYGKNVIHEQGASAKIRTGIDSNGDEPDVEIVLHPDYANLLWFDPDPLRREAPVPDDRLDAVSVFLHELGHAWGFNGWLDTTTGELTGEVLSMYDRCVVHDGSDFYFVGLEATKVYGRPILLSRVHNNYHHVGNTTDGPYADLARDLMNGVSFDWGTRYAISPLDLAILADCGVPVKKERYRPAAEETESKPVTK